MKHLGTNNTKIFKFSKNYKNLEKIERVIKKECIYGYDYWNSYEFSFLHKKQQKIKILEIKIPLSSKYTVESKSLKIYLNNFYNTNTTEKDVLKLIEYDLSKLCEIPIRVSFIDKFKKEPISINLHFYKNKFTKPNTVYLYEGFRSICPVTSQPDWASIYIKSDTKMDTQFIIKFLYSYRNKGDFHEECISGIYRKLLIKYKPTDLTVYGRFLRRGGIDINPFRTLKDNKNIDNFRTNMQ